MARVEDRWEKVVSGQRIRTSRYGAGKRWRARYVDGDGRERSQTFVRKGDAERFLVAVEADHLLRGTYVDPQRAKLTVGASADRWLAAQPLRPSLRRSYEIYLRTRSCPRWGQLQQLSSDCTGYRCAALLECSMLGEVVRASCCQARSADDLWLARPGRHSASTAESADRSPIVLPTRSRARQPAGR